MGSTGYARRGGLFTTTDGMLVEIPPSGFNWRTVRHVIGSIDPFAEEATQQFPLGTKLTYGEEVYRYTRCGGTGIEVSALCQAVVPLAGHINEAIDAPLINTYAIAFTPNTVTTDDLLANELQDGYILIYDGTGEGHKYRIKSHPAILGGASGTLTLIDSIRV